MQYSEFISLIQKNKLPVYPVYIFSGLEDSLKEKGIMLFKEVHKDISDEVIYFRQDNFSSSSFLNELCVLPFFKKRKLVILELSAEHNFREEVKDALISVYLKNPSDYIILLIKTEQPFILPDKSALNIECNPIEYNELPRWVINQVKGYGKSISRSTTKLIIEYSGDNLRVIDEIIQKVALFIGSRTEIEESDVRSLVESELKGDIKKLIYHIKNGQTTLALEELEQLLSLGEPADRIIGFLGWQLRSQSSMKQAEHLAILLQTDKAIKTGLMPDELALKRLIVQL